MAEGSLVWKGKEVGRLREAAWERPEVPSSRHRSEWGETREAYRVCNVEGIWKGR